MSVSSVIPSYHLAATVRYSMDDSGHSDGKERYLCCTGVGMDNSIQTSKHFIQQMTTDLKLNGRDQKTGKSIQCYRYLQSFSKKELVDVSIDDIQTAHQIGVDFAKKMFPGYKALVVTQNDGSGACLHNHITVVNARNTDGRCLRGKQTRWIGGVKEVSDEIVKNYIHDRFDTGREEELQSTSLALDVIHQKNKKLEASGAETKYVAVDDLYERVMEAREKAVSWADFLQQLAIRSVHIRDLLEDGKPNPKHKYITFELDDLDRYFAAGGKRKSISFRGSKKDAQLSKDALIEYFSEKHRNRVDMAEAILNKNDTITTIYERTR